MDNIEQTDAPEKPDSGRRPGKPKGYPKPPGSGRQPGTPNKSTRDIREAAQRHGAKALAAFVKLLGNPDPKVQALAAREILDRGYGRPVSPAELTGKDGAPLHPADEISDREAAHRLMFLLAEARREDRRDGFLPDTLSELAAELAADELDEAGKRDEAGKMSDRDVAKRLIFTARQAGKADAAAAGNVTPIRPEKPQAPETAEPDPALEPGPIDDGVEVWVDEKGKSYPAGTDRLPIIHAGGYRFSPPGPRPTPKVITGRRR